MASRLLPGDHLGTEEEIPTEAGTFAENGEVYVSVLGSGASSERLQQVMPRKLARRLKKGDVVFGLVTDVFEALALVDIEPKKGRERSYAEGHAVLRVTEIAKGQGFIEDLRDFVRIGDYLTAEILEVTPTGTYISIAKPELGVVRAFCSVCRGDLRQRGRVLVCLNCGSKEPRKLAEANH